MTLSDLMQQHATSVFTRDDHFGESIEYWPKGAEEGRSIQANVERHPPEGTPPMRSVSTTSTMIDVRNDDELGISSAEVDTGGDSVVFAVRLGETPQRKSIKRIVTQDPGMLRLEVR